MLHGRLTVAQNNTNIELLVFLTMLCFTFYFLHTTQNVDVYWIWHASFFVVVYRTLPETVNIIMQISQKLIRGIGITWISSHNMWCVIWLFWCVIIKIIIKYLEKTRLKSAKTKNSCFSHALFIFVCLKCDLFVVHSINITEYEISVIEFKMYPICWFVQMIASTTDD